MESANLAVETFLHEFSNDRWSTEDRRTSTSFRAGISQGSTWFLVIFPPSGRGESSCSSRWMAMRKIFSTTLAFQFMQVLSAENMVSCLSAPPTRYSLTKIYNQTSQRSWKVKNPGKGGYGWILQVNIGSSWKTTENLSHHRERWGFKYNCYSNEGTKNVSEMLRSTCWY